MSTMTPKQSWADGPLLGFDLETTGVDVETDIAVTISLVDCQPGAEPVPFEWLIDPGDREIPASATEIHGITTEHAREFGISAAQAWEECEQVLRDRWKPDVPLAAYNLHFDVTMADRELGRHRDIGMPVDSRFFVDPIVIGRANDRARYGKGGWKLGAACERYGVTLDNAHNSTADTLATLGLVQKMAIMWPGSVGYLDLATLQHRQIAWNRSRCTGMHRWLMGEAQKMERAWSSGNLRYVYDKLAGLGVTDEVTDEVVGASCAQTRAMAASFLFDANGWPMRQRPAAPVAQAV